MKIRTKLMMIKHAMDKYDESVSVLANARHQYEAVRLSSEAVMINTPQGKRALRLSEMKPQFAEIEKQMALFEKVVLYFTGASSIDEAREIYAEFADKYNHHAAVQQGRQRAEVDILSKADAESLGFSWPLDLAEISELEIKANKALQDVSNTLEIPAPSDIELPKIEPPKEIRND